MFDIFDEDKDGRLNINEFKTILLNLGLESEKNNNLVMKKLYGSKRFVSYADVMKILDLENVPKRVDFAEIDNIKSFIRP